MDKSILKQ